MITNNKYKINDYVISLFSNKKGRILEISKNKYVSDDCLYWIEDYEFYVEERNIILMNTDQIEQYKLEKLTDKFNI